MGLILRQKITIVVLGVVLGLSLVAFVLWVGTLRDPNNHELGAVAIKIASRSGPDFIYPPATVTGVINPAVTQSNIKDTICKSGWTATIRPSANYTNKLKTQQLQSLGYCDVKQDQKGNLVPECYPGKYEEDHFISLELGGHPTDPANLFPEPYNTSVGGITVGARQKDQVENYLNKQVCAGFILLKQGQDQITTDWYAIYLKIHKLQTESSNTDD